MPRVVKKCLILLGLLVLGGAGLTLIANKQLPQIANKTLKEQLGTLGFTQAKIPAPEKHFGALYYKDIELSEDGRSYIDSITLHYGIMDLFLKRKITSLRINGLALSGEMSNTGILKLSGLENTATLWNLNQTKIKTINLRNATLSVLSAHLGGIRLGTDIQIRISKKKTHWIGHLESREDQFQMIAKIKGQMNKNGAWQNDIDVESGKIERDFGKTTRMSGRIAMQGEAKTLTQINSDLRAGGMTFSGLPWRNVSITANGNPQDLTLFASGKSIGFEGLELGIDARLQNMFKNDQSFEWSTRIHAEKMANLLDTMDAQNLLPLPRENLRLLDRENDIEFATVKTGNRLKFNLSNIEKDIDINGIIKTKKDKSKLIQFTSAPLSIHKTNTLSPYIGEGKMLLSGQFTLKDDNADGAIKAEIKHSTLKRGAIPIDNIGGIVVIDDLNSFSASKDPTLTCKDNARQNNKTCNLTLRLKNGNISIRDASLDLLDGTLNISPPKPSGKQTIVLQDVNINELLKTIGIKDVKAKGLLEGSITFSNTAKDGTIIHNALISNAGNGILQINSPALLALSSDDVLERETMALALKNYHFETLNIRASGPINGEMKLSVKAHGRNPDILGKRLVAINFETITALPAFLQNIVPQQK